MREIRRDGELRREKFTDWTMGAARRCRHCVEARSGIGCAQRARIVRGLRLRSWIRALVLGWFVMAGVAPASAWMLAGEPDECHGCCAEMLRTADPAPAASTDLPPCCLVLPIDSSAPMPARTLVQVTPLASLDAVQPDWAHPPLAPSPPRASDPPLRSMPVLLRTSVLLI